MKKYQIKAMAKEAARRAIEIRQQDLADQLRSPAISKIMTEIFDIEEQLANNEVWMQSQRKKIEKLQNKVTKKLAKKVPDNAVPANELEEQIFNQLVIDSIFFDGHDPETIIEDAALSVAFGE
jgi:hypothetical protein